MINEKLPKTCNVKGLVTVELFDAKTGELEFREQKENFIAIPAKEWWALGQLMDLGYTIPGYNIGSAYSNIRIPPPFQYLYISGDDSTEDPSTERYWKMPMIGYALKDFTYSGSSEKRGTINLNESTFESDKTTLIFDFPNHCANGTFQSIGLATTPIVPNNMSYRNALITNNNVTPEYIFPQGLLIQQSHNDTASYDGGRFYHEGELYILNSTGNIISVENPSTNKKIRDINLDTTGLQGLGPGLTIDPINSIIYVCNDVNSLSYSHIRKYDLEGNLETTIPSEVSNMSSIYYDEGGFWIGSSNGNINELTGRPWNRSLYKMDLDGNIIDVLDLDIDNIADGWNSNLSPATLGTVRYKEDILAVSIRNAVNGGFKLGIALYSLSDKKIIALFENLMQGSTAIGFYGLTYDPVEDVFYSYYQNNNIKFRLAGLSSRVRLSSPQTKKSTQTMKVTYELSYEPLF